ncbi:hypothetical protein [Streptomyces flavofungini]|uniref:Hsp70 family protein n=1 Tax=Streptomyces flavofungini TaxID=68200 RepID=A0ABS0WYQ3_9ACTN|nr:hypothetical protein [Streptomyces flavofungini]MBJ3806067.1 hypothetical protein [Streptomyces flavofungini]GHC87477.1 hypothetical protein GCM10010349_74100 [Streptomyces flavofungini]
MGARFRVAAAIDFGTHASGYAWTAVSRDHADPRRRDIVDRENWPETTEKRYPKTRSALLLDSSGAVLAWGHPAVRAARPPGSRLVTGMKMSLRPADDPSRPAPGNRVPRALDDDLSRPVPLIATYLERLRAAAVAEITAAGGYRESDIRWCLTVPAIWSQAALGAMREAAETAGFPAGHDTLLLEPEPDMAALYCAVKELAPTGPVRSLLGAFRRSGQRFVVADCGGGTVDVVAYEVLGDGSLAQLRRPSGGAFGATYTTNGFIKDVLGSRFLDQTNLERLTRYHWTEFQELLSDWETHRNRFTVGSRESVALRVDGLHGLLSPDDLRHLGEVQGGKGDRLVVRPKEMADLLEAAVGGILPLIDAHVETAAEGGGAARPDVYLVGGFSKSPYLRERVRAHVGKRARVFMPDRPERAVLHGAVHRCYASAVREGDDVAAGTGGGIGARRSGPDITERCALYTYGARVSVPYEDADGAQDRALEHNDEGRPFCPDRFLRFVTIGRRVGVGHEVAHRNLVPIRADRTHMTVDFYATHAPDPRYYDSAPAKRIGDITVDLSSCMHLPRESREVDVHLSFGRAEITVRAVNRHDGQAVDATLDLDPEF